MGSRRAGLGVRKMGPQELESVVDLWWQSHEASTSWLRPDQKFSADESKSFFRTVVAEACELWVAEADGELLGMLALDGDQLDRLYVSPPAQGRGVGSALLEQAKALSADGLRLVTLQRNVRACRFYERRGFVAYEFGRSALPEDEPDVWYRWSG